MIKRLLLFSLILFSFIFTGFSIVEDDFVRPNNTTLGTATNGNIWQEVEVGTGEFEIISNSLFYDLNSAPAGNSNNWAFLNNTNSNNIRIDYINYTVSTALTMSNRQQYLIGGSSNLNESNQATESSYYIITEQSGVGGMAYFSGGSWNSLNYTVSNGETINVSLRNINYTSDTFDFYVNDILRKSGAAFRNNADTFKQGILYVEIGTINSGDISIGCIVTDSSVCFSEETQITFNNPTQGQFLNDTNFILNVSFSETTNSTYILNGGSETTLGTNENESTVNLTGVEGLNNITVFTNTSGDLNNKSINFTIDTINPIINDSIPTEINDYNFDGSWFSCSDTNLASCNISIDGFNQAAGTNFTLTNNGNLSYNITAIDSAGNTNETSGVLFVNPINYFQFHDGTGFLTNFTFGGRSDGGTGVVNYTHYNDGLILGNNTLLFERLGYVSENFSFILNTTNQLNETFNVTPAQIIVNLFNREDGSVLTVSTDVTIFTLGNITTTTGQAIFQDFNFLPGNYSVEAVADGFYTEQQTFTYDAESNAVINLFLLNLSQNNTATLVVATTDEWDNVLGGVDVRLQEYDPSIFGFKQVSQCLSNSNGECQFLIEQSTKSYRLIGSTVINGITYTATNPLEEGEGETFLPVISGGSEVVGQEIVRQLKLKISGELNPASLLGLTINAPVDADATIVAQNTSTTIINVPVDFIATNGLSYTVCFEVYVTSGNNFNEVITPVCSTGASGILPTANVSLNNNFDYEARITVEFDGNKETFKRYLYPNQKSWAAILEEQALVSNMVIFFWSILLAFSLYLRNLAIWSWGAMFLAGIQVLIYPNILVASSSVIIIIVNAIVLYISKKEVDSQ